jgi:hypothetical protein
LRAYDRLVRLDPMEIYILDFFRERRTTQLPLSEIVGDSTVNRFGALGNALHELEVEHGMLQRGDRDDIFELTALGRKYLGMIS